MLDARQACTAISRRTSSRKLDVIESIGNSN